MKVQDAWGTTPRRENCYLKLFSNGATLVAHRRPVDNEKGSLTHGVTAPPPLPRCPGMDATPFPSSGGPPQSGSANRKGAPTPRAAGAATQGPGQQRSPDPPGGQSGQRASTTPITGDAGFHAGRQGYKRCSRFAPRLPSRRFWNAAARARDLVPTDGGADRPMIFAPHVNLFKTL